MCLVGVRAGVWGCLRFAFRFVLAFPFLVFMSYSALVCVLLNSSLCLVSPSLYVCRRSSFCLAFVHVGVSYFVFLALCWAKAVEHA